MTSSTTAPSSLTVASIHDYAQAIGASLATCAQDANGGAVLLDLSQVAAPDLSLLQLVESARAQARIDGSAIRLAEPAGPALGALLDRAGFVAAMSPADIDFWFHGELPQ